MSWGVRYCSIKNIYRWIVALGVCTGLGQLSAMAATGTVWPGIEAIVPTDDLISICDRTYEVRVGLLAAVDDLRFARGDTADVHCDQIDRAELAEIRVLLLNGLGLRSLQSGDFADLPNLKLLDLGENSLRILPGDIFDPVPHLEALVLSRNELRGLPVDVFTPLRQLRILSLGHNTLSALRDRAFVGNLNLETLILSGNRLQRIPDSIFVNNKYLRVVDLSDNFFRELPRELFRQSENLERVDLSYNMLTHLESAAFITSPRLKGLNLSGNRIHTVEQARIRRSLLGPAVRVIFEHAERSPKIASFAARSIAIRQALQRSLHKQDVNESDLSTIQLLNLADIQIGQLLPGDFSGLSHLQTLDLSNTGIETLPDGFFHELPQLRNLILAGNNFRADEADRILDQARERDIYVEISKPGEDLQTVRFRPGSASPYVQLMIEDAQQFVLNNWRVPLDITVEHAGSDDGVLSDPEHRLQEERLLVQQVYEVKQAYRRAAFDFYRVKIQLDSGNSEASFVQVKGEDASILIRVSVGQSYLEWDLRPVLESGKILEELGRSFSWSREYSWYSNTAQSVDLVSALRRDFVKTARIDQQSSIDLRRLQGLIDTAEDRAADRQEERAFFSESELNFARLVQFRTLYSVQRLLNTVVRWRVALSDPSFEHGNEVRMLLSYSSTVYQNILNQFLEQVVGGRAVFNIFEKSWWVRNPIYRLLDSEVPEGYFEIEGRRSPAIAAGSIRGLLEERFDAGLRDFVRELSSMDQGLQAREWTASPLAIELTAAVGRLKALRKNYVEFSSVRAFKEWIDGVVKDWARAPYYQAVLNIATFLGHTRTTDAPAAVSRSQLKELKDILQPGDLLLLRRDFFLSNAFLPGFWPHTAIYVGPQKGWEKMKTWKGTTLGEDDWVRDHVVPNFKSLLDDKPPAVIEAIAPGVVFNSIEKALQKDYIAVLRPRFREHQEEIVAQTLQNAMRFLGRPYDFDFDYFSDDKIVCSELAYRAYHPYINFLVQKEATHKPRPRVPGMVSVMGRDTMPSNEIARLAVYMADHPEPDATIGYSGQVLDVVRLYMKEKEGYRARQYDGKDALERLRQSLEE